MYLVEALKVNGKARRTNWVYGAFAYLIKNKMVFNTGVVVELDLPTHDIFANDWQPYKEPCKHEPDLKMRGLLEVMSLPPDAPLEFECRHCLKPLKAKGWAEG